jgi:hypothetical protein
MEYTDEKPSSEKPSDETDLNQKDLDDILNPGKLYEISKENQQRIQKEEDNLGKLETQRFLQILCDKVIEASNKGLFSCQIKWSNKYEKYFKTELISRGFHCSYFYDINYGYNYTVSWDNIKFTKI